MDAVVELASDAYWGTSKDEKLKGGDKRKLKKYTQKEVDSLLAQKEKEILSRLEMEDLKSSIESLSNIVIQLSQRVSDLEGGSSIYYSSNNHYQE